MATLDDFDRPKALARRSDPKTSHDAAESLGEVALSDLQAKIVAVLRGHPFGLTVPDIARLLELPRDTISPRMTPLVDLNMIIRTEDTCRPQGHTRQCTIWRVKT